MNIHFLFALCSVLIWNEEVLAEIDNEIKRGVFPFMAFIYYPDETVVDATGARFQRSATLIKPQWLVSAAIDHGVLDNVSLGFPRKTLLARVGAVTLDSNFTLNEDEDEQEREVIKIIRPSIHNPEAWWFTDITLLKTLLPFKMTSAVASTSISFKRQFTDKNCVILVFAKRYANATEDKVLLQLGMELLPPSRENCGTQFSDTTMICALDGDEAKTSMYENDYCQGNSGGPLLCEGDVMALQTYIDNNCKQPHLYQLLASWETFITCGTEENCYKNEQCNVCVVINKDTEVNNTTSPAVSLSVLDTNISISEIVPQETGTNRSATRLPENMISENVELSSELTLTDQRRSEDHSEHQTEGQAEDHSEHQTEGQAEDHSEHQTDSTTEDHSEHQTEGKAEDHLEHHAEGQSEDNSSSSEEHDSENHTEYYSEQPRSIEPTYEPLPQSDPPTVPPLDQPSDSSENTSTHSLDQSTKNSLENQSISQVNLTEETNFTTDSSINSSFSLTGNNKTFRGSWPPEDSKRRTVKTEEVTRKPKVQELRKVSVAAEPQEEEKEESISEVYSADANRGFGTGNYLIIFLSILACLI